MIKNELTKLLLPEAIELAKKAKGYRELLKSDCAQYPELVSSYAKSLDQAIIEFEAAIGYTFGAISSISAEERLSGES